MLEVRNLYKDYVPQCNSIEDMIAETKRRTWIKIVNNIRVPFGCTLQQTMDLLEIPAEERPLILEKLQADANEIEDGNNLIAAEKVHKDCVDNGGESTPAYRDEEFKARWFALPVADQMANIGKEVAEAIRWKEKGDHQKTRNFCNNAIELLILTEEDPKHGRCAVEEFNNAVEELRDYFLGDNIYETTDEMLMHYYGPFMSRRNKHWRT